VSLARPDLTAAGARESAVVALAPIAAAGQTAAAFLTAEALGAAPGPASLLALLHAFAFSSLVFGSLPESYPLSGFLLSVAWLLAARTLRDGRLRVVATAVTASLVGGVTTTNFAFALLPWTFAAARLRGSWLGVLRLAVPAAALAVALAAGQLIGMNAAYGDHVPWHRLAHRTEPFLSAQLGATARELPWAFTGTLLAGPPVRMPTEIGAHRGYRYKEMFTSRETHEPPARRVLRLLAVIGLLALGAYRLSSGAAAPLVGAALATLVVSAALHSIYRGTDLLLYSQHWLPACVLLAAGLALGTRAERMTLAIVTVLTAALNVSVLVGMVGELTRASWTG
jgi:hypothetical protein